MSTTAFTAPAMFAGRNCGERVSSFMPMHSTRTSRMTPAADRMLIRTGVLASVFLFVFVSSHISIIPLLLGLVLLLSLTLSGLTGLRGLVGRTLNTA